METTEKELLAGKLSVTEACHAEVALEPTGQTKGPHTGLQDSS